MGISEDLFNDPFYELKSIDRLMGLNRPLTDKPKNRYVSLGALHVDGRPSGSFWI